MPGGTLTDDRAKRQRDQQGEYDRLLHRRKVMSGSEFAGVGLQFAATLVLFALAGVWLDRRLGTSPWLVIVMVFAGASLGFWSMVRRMNSFNARRSTPSDKNHGDASGGAAGPDKR